MNWLNCARQNQVNERIIEPKSKPKGTVLYTIWPVIDKSDIKANEQREDRCKGKQPKSVEIKGWFPYDRYDRCNHWKQRSAIVAII